ncbi:protease SohB [[Haemophilus] ducreyi]|uniref:protease SohB n=1 Tax=Haemophilus ducreyi TaxID=730 RepID=UPI000655AA15|nr:protease SohB [[Haemophilus] ducreyi]AKO46102.1 peptidase [[Haemophilus] ducreyi]AKO47443.1 peptidase [[Haemophilus] ducreyi]AKO48826.1 peptidase [[Haemophilus] ducreyi]AKO50194.1 peptidase [[Haemophilus] ducreyi]ANF62598.1 protease SohB [[Haemophilus] ducreyi]
MWKEILLNYGIFLLELLTIFGIIAMVIIMLADRKNAASGAIAITNLTEKYKEQQEALANFLLSEEAQKQSERKAKKLAKQKVKEEKRRLKAGEEKLADAEKARLFVLKFNGDLHASAVQSLHKEVSAIISVARPQDEVLLQLESPGGVVHGYGLAASQLQRLRDHHIPLTVTVDKVAASGGYMMACVANKIVAAPFAILGSVGVVAQVPNIHRFLKKHEIDVDVMTAGEYKRTVTLAGENTEKGKQKFQQELEETHQLFKQFVANNRPQLEIEKVATGEHWFGQQALTLNLIDEIATSDDLILNAVKDKEVIKLAFKQKKKLAQRLGSQMEQSLENLIAKLLHKNRSNML